MRLNERSVACRWGVLRSFAVPHGERAHHGCAVRREAGCTADISQRSKPFCAGLGKVRQTASLGIGMASSASLHGAAFFSRGFGSANICRSSTV
ncbi:hypothetical protein XHV734_4907 [Xanthomonas hortorum pv. vitians]|nr:hypothetical protein XHV734_4907 [Xanthomonas hortorum pv. vitians]